MRRWQDILRRGFGRGAFPHELWFLLEVPGRRLIQSPEKLADRLCLAPGSRVLEIGPGSGFFSVAVARRIAAGRLELLDLQPAMLERIRRKMRRAALGNVGYTAGSAGALPFARDSFDVAFMVAVLGEVPDEAACLREVWRVLRPGGLLSVTEQWLDPDFVALEPLVGLAVRQGFAREETWGPRRGFTANFRKPRTAAERA